MLKFLVETALLTHGLCSVTNEDLLKSWQFSEQNIAWVERGKIIIGDMERYLTFRDCKDNLLRIDCDMFDTALNRGLTGALTASGTMALCQRMGLKLAVTCGMGGIGKINAESLCPDLPALAELPVSLLATGPKDMLDVNATMEWLKSNFVTIRCMNKDRYTGYIFKSSNVAVEQAAISDIHLGQYRCLLLNQIPESKRIADFEILRAGIAAGEKAELQGAYYHPAANREFDRLTNGNSSKIQVASLINNVKLAQSLVEAM